LKVRQKACYNYNHNTAISFSLSGTHILKTRVLTNKDHKSTFVL